MAAVGVAKPTDWLRCCYNGHLEHPHSKAVSMSSEYEVPSLQRKTTFLLLLLVTPQQTPGGAVAWQDRGQSMRGILLVDVHVRIVWWRFSCSLTISPWHVSSGHWWQNIHIRYTVISYLLISIFNSFLLIFNLTCVTGRSSVARLTVADWLSHLWHTTLPVSTALPSAGQRLLSSITVLTLVAITTLTTVRLALWHAQTMNTSGPRRRRQRENKLL